MQNNCDVKFEVLRMPPENTNSLLVISGNDAVIFDAWGRADDWVHVLNERGVNLRAIYATHGHSDHISAAPTLATRFDVSWYMNAADTDLILWGNPILDMFELPNITSDFKRPEKLDTGTYEILPGITMQAFSTPGHSLGGMMFFWPEYNILMTGDTIFHDGVGRTDLPGGDASMLRSSVHTLCNMNLADETYVVHGHGMDSTMEWLRHNHPYFLINQCNCGGNGCDHGDNHHCCCGCDK